MLLSLCHGTVLAAPSLEKNHSHHSKKQDFEGKVNIGGLSLYVNIQGASKRSKNEPVVIFESGYGDDHSVWSAVQTQVAKKTQTVSYDRVGLGQSDKYNGPKDAKAHAVQLHYIHTENPQIVINAINKLIK